MVYGSGSAAYSNFVSTETAYSEKTAPGLFWIRVVANRTGPAAMVKTPWLGMSQGASIM